MPRLLLVETDPLLQRAFQQLLEDEGHFCALVDTPAAALQTLRDDAFDLVVLDVGRFREEGLELVLAIRRLQHLPILFLAPPSDVADAMLALADGADDYLCDPFDPRELLGRVRAQLRRAGEYRDPPAVDPGIDLGGVVLNVALRDAFRDGVPLHLTTREFDLLHLLVRHPNQPLTSAWIFESLWGAVRPGMKALTVYIGRLRRKIELNASRPRIVVSVHGYGYKAVVPVP